MFIGFAPEGATFIHDFLTSGSTPAPVTPLADPTFAVYGDDGALDGETGTAAVTDEDVTGLYRFSIDLSGPYSAGNSYTVLATWAVSAVVYAQVFKFTVV